MHNLLVKLSVECNNLPASLFIQGIELADHDVLPVAVGGFAEIYRGQYRGKSVAIKVLRTHRNMDMQWQFKVSEANFQICSSELVLGYIDALRRNACMAAAGAPICSTVSGA